MSLFPLFAPAAFLETRHTISADTSDVNMFTLMGSPTGVRTYRLIINAGVTINASSTSTPALRTGNFPTGSVVIIENRGTIKGRGGTGGAGDGVGANGGGAGNPGGNAIQLDRNARIDNSSGFIYGGGGGGGGGGYGFNQVADGGDQALGGAGGTGAGPNAATAGNPPIGGSLGGAGGAGGDYGSAGNAGGGGSGYTIATAGGAGGAAGKAVNLNGYAVTWIAGNNSTQVKGAVS